MGGPHHAEKRLLVATRVGASGDGGTDGQLGDELTKTVNALHQRGMISQRYDGGACAVTAELAGTQRGTGLCRHPCCVRHRHAMAPCHQAQWGRQEVRRREGCGVMPCCTTHYERVHGIDAGGIPANGGRDSAGRLSSVVRAAQLGRAGLHRSKDGTAVEGHRRIHVDEDVVHTNVQTRRLCRFSFQIPDNTQRKWLEEEKKKKAQKALSLNSTFVCVCVFARVCNRSKPQVFNQK